MSDATELNKAIIAHGGWKIRLADAIETGRSDFTPEKAGSNVECVFGQWLQSLSPVDRATEYYKAIVPLHDRFHREAARILRLALQGHKAEAKQALTDIRSEFVTTSASLINLMTEWKNKSRG